MTPCPGVVASHWHFPVGVGAIILALLGVLLPWREKPLKKRWKLLGSALMVVCLVVELISIRVDHKQHDAEAAHTDCENKELLAKAKEGIDTTESSNKESISVITGGDTFGYIDYKPRFDGFEPVLIKVGGYPLRLRSVRIDNQTKIYTDMATAFATNPPNFERSKALAALDTQNLHPEDVNTSQVTLEGTQPYPDGDSQQMVMRFDGVNGVWIESFSATRVNGSWYRALYVKGTVNGEIKRYKQVDDGYGKDDTPRWYTLDNPAPVSRP